MQIVRTFCKNKDLGRAYLIHQPPFILLVEDDERLREIETRCLQAAGYIVLKAGSFAEALDRISIKPSLMILDIHLPDVSGWEVARWLEGQTSGVPVIVTSGFTADRKQIEHFKPVVFLAKPFSIADLLGLVVKYAAKS